MLLYSLDAVKLSFRTKAENFKSSSFIRLTDHNDSSVYHPQTNGLTEQFNQTMQAGLIKVVNSSQDDWDEHLSAVLFAYQTSLQKATKLTQ